MSFPEFVWGISGRKVGWPEWGGLDFKLPMMYALAAGAFIYIAIAPSPSSMSASLAQIH